MRALSYHESTLQTILIVDSGKQQISEHIPYYWVCSCICSLLEFLFLHGETTASVAVRHLSLDTTNRNSIEVFSLVNLGS